MVRLPLQPHPAAGRPVVASIDVTVERQESVLGLEFEIRGDMASVRIPGLAESRFRDGLWHHTCLEMFLAERATPAGNEAAERREPYTEYNFSPSREWAVYRFRFYRDPTPIKETQAVPCLTVDVSEQCLLLRISIDLSSLGFLSQPLQLGVAAVIEAADGTLSYWALHHPVDRPDFHHPAGRKLVIGRTTKG